MKKTFSYGHRHLPVAVHGIVLCLALLAASCRGAANPQKTYKDEYPYFMALRAADDGDEKSAIRLFTEGRKKSNALTRRKCAEALTQLGTVKERLDACAYVMAAWHDEAALVTVCSELERIGEYAKIIAYTDGVDPAAANNDLMRLRMTALYEKGDSRFSDELFVWMTRRALTSFHMEIYNRYVLPKSEDELTSEEQIMAYRVLVWRRSYVSAYNRIADMLALCDDNLLDELPLLISDMGKASMYGSLDFYNAARTFDKIVARTAGESAFYASFYAGRLFDKAGRYPGYAVSRFTAAMESAASESQYDNALWYLFNTQLRTSTEEILASLNTYGGSWHDASYFDDFFESLSVLLISHHEWQNLYNVWKAVDKTASEETAGKYAYLAGRLVEEGLAKDGTEAPTRQAVAAFSRVLNSGASLYYKACALERLNIQDPAVIAGAFSGAGLGLEEPDRDAERFLSACAAFGFPQKLYGEWLQYRAKISVETAVQLSQFLAQCTNIDAKYGVQSLRIASYAERHASGKLPKELLLADFPRFYAEPVNEAAAEDGIEPALLYALIRSESFFDAEVSSVSGAQGLTQLLESTAKDMARKLHFDEYDILEPRANIRMGSYYLGELIRRTDNLPLLAVFAYNAGLTNVRRWVQQSRSDWLMGHRSRHPATGISPDLFLETLPFSETREYGRKIVGAAALYGWLYYGKHPGETVRALMQ